MHHNLHPTPQCGSYLFPFHLVICQEKEKQTLYRVRAEFDSTIVLKDL